GCPDFAVAVCAPAPARGLGVLGQDVVVVTNDQERLRVLANGNVGLGTTTPREQLELTGNLRLPPTSATGGIVRVGDRTFLHSAGRDNVFLGPNAGTLTTTGSHNVGVGDDALQSVTTGSDNTAVGAGALKAATAGNQNTATGADALAAN